MKLFNQSALTLLLAALGIASSPLAHAQSTPDWTLICNPSASGPTIPKEIRASLDDLTGPLGGEQEAPVWVDGIQSSGYVSLVQSHDENEKGVWLLTVNFGDQMVLKAQTKAVFENPSNGERVIDRGPGQLTRFGRQLISNARCRVITSCTSDLRVCPE